MALIAAYMTPEIYYACTLHALSVEAEEIVGLLIGKYVGGNAYIRSIMMMQRSDKRRDRVEISPEQLYRAMTNVSELSEKYNEPMNLIGWYHSHPHITVVPSHVDLRTQATYQSMDNRFVGVIVSCFTEDKFLGQKIQVTCYQSSNSQQHLPIPLHIEGSRSVFNPCLDAVFELPDMLNAEELANYSKSNSTELLTKLHNESAFVSSMCHLLKTIVNPLILHAENRITSSEMMCTFLKNEQRELVSKIRMKKLDI